LDPDKEREREREETKAGKTITVCRSGRLEAPVMHCRLGESLVGAARAGGEVAGDYPRAE
jgi:hypothetical protein